MRYIERGNAIQAPSTMIEAKARATSELAQLSPRTRRFANPQPYPVGLDKHVHTRKLALIAAARARGGHS